MTVSIEINPSVTPEIGLQCNLTCTVTGAESYNPAITYQWFKNGVIISNATNSVLSIRSLEHIDAGQYMCIVNLTSEKLIPSFISNMSNIYLICFTPGINLFTSCVLITANINFVTSCEKRDHFFCMGLCL